MADSVVMEGKIEGRAEDDHRPGMMRLRVRMIDDWINSLYVDVKQDSELDLPLGSKLVITVQRKPESIVSTVAKCLGVSR